MKEVIGHNLRSGPLSELKYNTRIAPSPTGDMHMGTARTAYFNWLVARSTGGKFHLRIDDTDTNRNDPSKVDDILTVMDWLGLDYDSILYQSHRIKYYRSVAECMIDQGFARADGDSIVLDLDNYSKDDGMRQFFSILKRGDLYWTDTLAGEIQISNQDYDYIKSMPLIKGDGMPTYNFASVIDDDDLDINYVIRGLDHLKNTSKQIVLYILLGNLPMSGAMIPAHSHVGLLFNNKKKLSKRDGAASMISYMEQGYDPDAMLNFLLRLGWGPKIDDKTAAILTRNDALKHFIGGGNMKNTPANIDLQKLGSFDRKYKGRKKNGTL